MPHAIDNDPARLDVELNAIVAGPQTKTTGQIAGQWFGATDLRPAVESFNELQHSRLYWSWQPREIFKRRRGHQDVHLDNIDAH